MTKTDQDTLNNQGANMKCFKCKNEIGKNQSAISSWNGNSNFHVVCWNETHPDEKVSPHTPEDNFTSEGANMNKKIGVWEKAIPELVKKIKAGGEAEKFAVAELKRLARQWDDGCPSEEVS